MMRLLLFAILYLLVLTGWVSAAHYVVGQVSPALDTTSANGRTVMLWNPANGINDNLTDTVGTTGNSGVSDTYFIDCELLNTPCDIDDQINVTLIDDGSGYIATNPVNITVTGAGFDLAPNITMNTPPQIVNLTVDDMFSSPANEIDLTPATNTTVHCSGVVVEYDGIGTFANHSSAFYSVNSSFFNDTDDNNYHYTNNTCDINTSYGDSTQALINCSYQVAYFANAESWQCTINVTDTVPTSANYSDATTINALLSVWVNDTMDFGIVNADAVSNETTMEVINYGNIEMNLSLRGYGQSAGDGNAMQCGGGNISIEEMRFNITASTPGQLNRSQAIQTYDNLTTNATVTEFNLAFRTNDTSNDARNDTFWRMYVPIGVHGSCNGSVIFGAVQT